MVSLEFYGQNSIRYLIFIKGFNDSSSNYKKVILLKKANFLFFGRLLKKNKVMN